MIKRLHNNVHIVTQHCPVDHGMPEPAIAVHSEATPLIILTQGDQEILINPESINDLCHAIKKVHGLI